MKKQKNEVNELKAAVKSLMAEKKGVGDKSLGYKTIISHRSGETEDTNGDFGLAQGEAR